MTGAGNDLVHLVTRQLASFSRLCALGDLYLYLAGVHQVLGCHTEAPGRHLLDLAVQGYAVLGAVEAGVVFSALARVAAAPKLVKRKGYGFVSLVAQGSEGHCATHKSLYNLLFRLHFLYGDGVLLESEEISQEERLLAGVHYRGEVLELGVGAFPGGNLQRGYRLRRPRVQYAVLAEGVLSHHWQEVSLRLGESLRVQADGVARDGLERDAFHAGRGGAEVFGQQLSAETHGLEDLGSAVRAYGADTHLAEDFQQALVHCLYVIVPCSHLVHLEGALVNLLLDYGECHIRVHCAGTVSQQQRRVHNFTDFSALHDKRCLHPLLDGYKVMVDGAHGKQRGNSGVVLVKAAVCQDYVVDAVVHRALSLAAEFLQSVAQALLSLCRVEEHRQFLGIESLVADVAEDVQFSVGDDGLGEPHHLAMGTVRGEDVHSHCTNVFRKGHNQFFPDGVYRRVGNLRELLSEIVEQQLRSV